MGFVNRIPMRVPAQWILDMEATWDLSPSTPFRAMGFVYYKDKVRAYMADLADSGAWGRLLQRSGKLSWSVSYAGDYLRPYLALTRYPILYALPGDLGLLLAEQDNYNTGNGQVWGMTTGVPATEWSKGYATAPFFLRIGASLYVASPSSGLDPSGARLYSAVRANLNAPNQSWADLAVGTYVNDPSVTEFDGVLNGRGGYYMESGGALVYTSVTGGPIISRIKAVRGDRLWSGDYTNQRVLRKSAKEGPWEAVTTLGYDTYDVASDGAEILVAAVRTSDNKGCILRYNENEDRFVLEHVFSSGTVDRLQYLHDGFYAALSNGQIHRKA